MLGQRFTRLCVASSFISSTDWCCYLLNPTPTGLENSESNSSVQSSPPTCLSLESAQPRPALQILMSSCQLMAIPSQAVGKHFHFRKNGLFLTAWYVENEQRLSWKDSRKRDSLHPGHTGMGFSRAAQTRWASTPQIWSSWDGAGLAVRHGCCFIGTSLAFGKDLYRWQSKRNL